MKLPSINNRELLPLRFIPFVLCFKPAPHSLVRLLTHEQSLAFPLFRPEDELFAYHLDSEGVPVRMNPREWDTLAEDMIILENQLRSEEEFEDEKYRTWRVEALKLLPARVFVWKDEFLSVFQASFNRNGQIYSENANVGTNELIFNPLIDPQYHSLVREGFEAVRLKQSILDAQPILTNYRVTAKMRSKIKVSLADFIRLFDITDLENWQRGLRFEHDSVWIVATLKGSFFPEELASLNEHPVKDLNKPVLSFPCTLSQLEEFIKEQGLTGYIHPADWDSFVQSEIKNKKGNEMKNDDAPAKQANAKEIESLLKLVIAMAIKGYRFDPKKRSSIPREIVSDVEQVGLSIDEDTVRKWLKQGVELLPPDGNKKD